MQRECRCEGGGENASKIRRRLFHAGRGRLGHHHHAPTAAAAVLSSTGVVAVCGCVQSLSFFVEWTTGYAAVGARWNLSWLTPHPPPCCVRLEEAFSSLSCVACCHYIVQVGMRTFYNYIDKRTHGVFAPPPQNRKRIVVVGLQQKCAKIIFEVSPKRSRDCPI